MISRLSLDLLYIVGNAFVRPSLSPKNVRSSDVYTVARYYFWFFLSILGVNMLLKHVNLEEILLGAFFLQKFVAVGHNLFSLLICLNIKKNWSVNFLGHEKYVEKGILRDHMEQFMNSSRFYMMSFTLPAKETGKAATWGGKTTALVSKKKC